jgi:mRNA-degrading endonuclease RelE of RelBE toxin-antitoxin system
MNSTSEYRAKIRKSFQEKAAAVEAALEEARKESKALDEQIAFASKVRDQAVAIQEAYKDNLSSIMNMAKKLRMRNEEVYKLRVGWNGELEVKEEETEVIDEIDAEHESDGDQEEDEFDDPCAQWLAEM